MYASTHWKTGTLYYLGSPCNGVPRSSTRLVPPKCPTSASHMIIHYADTARNIIALHPYIRRPYLRQKRSHGHRHHRKFTTGTVGHGIRRSHSEAFLAGSGSVAHGPPRSETRQRGIAPPRTTRILIRTYDYVRSPNGVTYCKFDAALLTGRSKGTRAKRRCRPASALYAHSPWVASRKRGIVNTLESNATRIRTMR